MLLRVYYNVTERNLDSMYFSFSSYVLVLYFRDGHLFTHGKYDKGESTWLHWVVKREHTMLLRLWYSIIVEEKSYSLVPIKETKLERAVF